MKNIIKDVDIGQLNYEGYKPIRLITSYGNIHGRYYQALNTKKAVIFVGGVGGDFDSPAKNMYPYLSQELISEKISSLRIQFRNPTNIIESVFDVLAGITFLKSQEIQHVGPVGHSFGGAVVIQSGVIAKDMVDTIVTLATQCSGTEYVDEIRDNCSILLIHGTSDQVIPSSCSSNVYEMAHDPKEIIIYNNAGHTLEEVDKEVYQTVSNWLTEQLEKKYF